MSALAALVNACMEAALPQAAEAGIARLSAVAAHAQECLEMLNALPPLVSLRRYGSARKLALVQLDALVERLATQAALALPYASRNLDADQSAALCEAVTQWQASLAIAELDADTTETWWQTLHGLVDDPRADRRVAGLTARLLHDADRLPTTQMQALLQRMLSPGEDSASAARFFEGFFEGAASQLLHQQELRVAVDAWLQTLDGDIFQQQLPLLRRVMSGLDGNERRHLLQRVLAPEAAHGDGLVLDITRLDEWNAHAQRLHALLAGREVAWPNRTR